MCNFYNLKLSRSIFCVLYSNIYCKAPKYFADKLIFYKFFVSQSRRVKYHKDYENLYKIQFNFNFKSVKDLVIDEFEEKINANKIIQHYLQNVHLYTICTFSYITN